jgi:outer membrane protein
MKWRFLCGVLALFLTSCLHDAADPFKLTPCSPFASWSPKQGNCLLSSRYCPTLLPPSFESSELNAAELIDIALQNNPQTKQTWAQARAAAAQYGQSLSSFYPNISFNGSYVRAKGTFIDIANIPIPFLTTQAGPDFLLTYTLFDFGQRTAASMAAREALYFADLKHNQEMQTIIQAVMNDYYNYLYQGAVLRANESNLENAQIALDAANQKFSLGLVALGDVAQARTQYLQNKINVTTQKQNVENAFTQLAVDLGLPSHLSFKVQPMPEQIVAHPIMECVALLVEEAQERRQDFLAAQADLKSKEAALLTAKRAIYPVLSTSLDAGYYWFDKGNHEKDMHWSAALNLQFPLFHGFYYKNGVKNAQANVELAKAKLLQTELSLIQDVTNAHMGVKTAAQNLTDSEEYLKAALLEFDIALTSYKAGTVTILEVMSAQSALADARSQRAGAQKNWFNALTAIAYATGSLCGAPDEKCL